MTNPLNLDLTNVDSVSGRALAPGSTTPSEAIPVASAIPLISVNLADVVDRRNSNRVSFDTTLRVATFTGEQLPPADRFVVVQGSDFSHTGISFMTSSWPASDQLLLMLNSQSKSVYAVARIIGCVSQKPANDEVPRFEVRCEFERWLEG